MIKTWQERCEEHPDHEGIVTEQMIRDRMQEEIDALRQAIEQAEKQEPAFYVIQATDRFGEGYEQTFWEDPAGFPVYTRPVYTSDTSAERVDETAKDRHEFECPRCGHCCRVEVVT